MNPLFLSMMWCGFRLLKPTGMDVEFGLLPQVNAMGWCVMLMVLLPMESVMQSMPNTPFLSMCRGLQTLRRLVSVMQLTDLLFMS